MGNEQIRELVTDPAKKFAAEIVGNFEHMALMVAATPAGVPMSVETYDGSEVRTMEFLGIGDSDPTSSATGYATQMRTALTTKDSKEVSKEGDVTEIFRESAIEDWAAYRAPDNKELRTALEEVRKAYAEISEKQGRIELLTRQAMMNTEDHTAEIQKLEREVETAIVRITEATEVITTQGGREARIVESRFLEMAEKAVNIGDMQMVQSEQSRTVNEDKEELKEMVRQEAHSMETTFRVFNMEETLSRIVHAKHAEIDLMGEIEKDTVRNLKISEELSEARERIGTIERTIRRWIIDTTHQKIEHEITEIKDALERDVSAMPDGEQKDRMYAEIRKLEWGLGQRNRTVLYELAEKSGSREIRGIAKLDSDLTMVDEAMHLRSECKRLEQEEDENIDIINYNREQINQLRSELETYRLQITNRGQYEQNQYANRFARLISSIEEIQTNEGSKAEKLLKEFEEWRFGAPLKKIAEMAVTSGLQRTSKGTPLHPNLSYPELLAISAVVESKPDQLELPVPDITQGKLSSSGKWVLDLLGRKAPSFTVKVATTPWVYTHKVAPDYLRMRWFNRTVTFFTRSVPAWAADKIGRHEWANRQREMARIKRELPSSFEARIDLAEPVEGGEFYQPFVRKAALGWGVGVLLIGAPVVTATLYATTENRDRQGGKWEMVAEALTPHAPWKFISGLEPYKPFGVSFDPHGDIRTPDVTTDLQAGGINWVPEPDEQNKYWEMAGIRNPEQQKFLNEHPELANKLWAWYTGIEYGRERTEKDVKITEMFSAGIKGHPEWWGQNAQKQPVYQRFETREMWDPKDPARLVLNTADELQETRDRQRVNIGTGSKIANAQVYGWNKGKYEKVGEKSVPVTKTRTVTMAPRFYTKDAQGKLREGPFEEVDITGYAGVNVNIVSQNKAGEWVKTGTKAYRPKTTTSVVDVPVYTRTSKVEILVAQLMDMQTSKKPMPTGEEFDRWMVKQGYKQGVTVEGLRLAIMQQYGVRTPAAIDFLLANPEARGIMGTLMQGNYRLTGDHTERIVALIGLELDSETKQVKTAMDERTAKITAEKEEAAKKAEALAKRRRKRGPVSESPAQTSTEQTPVPTVSWGEIGKRVVELTVSAGWAKELSQAEIQAQERNQLMGDLGLTAEQQTGYDHLFKFSEIRTFFETVQSGELERTTGKVLDKEKIGRLLESMDRYMDEGKGHSAKETVEAYEPNGERTKILESTMGENLYLNAKPSDKTPVAPVEWKKGLESYYDANPELQGIFKDRQEYMAACAKLLDAKYKGIIPAKPADQTDVYMIAGEAATAKSSQQKK